MQVKSDPAAAVVAHLPLVAAVALATGTVLCEGCAPRRRWSPRSPPGRPLLALALSLAVPSLDERYLAVSFPFVVVLLVLGVVAPGPRRPAAGDPGSPPPGDGLLCAPFSHATALLAALWLGGAVAQVAAPDAGVTPWRPAMEELRRAAIPGRPRRGQPRVLRRPGPRLRRRRARAWSSRGDPAAGGPDAQGGETWLLGVATSAPPGRAGAPRLDGGAGEELDDGNGLRLSRLVPVSPALQLRRRSPERRARDADCAVAPSAAIIEPAPGATRRSRSRGTAAPRSVASPTGAAIAMNRTYRAIVAFIRLLLRVFFRQVRTAGVEEVPRHGGGLLVAWHPMRCSTPG